MAEDSATDSAKDLTLWIWPHPSLQMPFDFDAKCFPQKIAPTASVGNLLEMIEDEFDELCRSQDIPFGFQIQVAWNIKNPTRALYPSMPIGANFSDGDFCGIYGDFQRIQAPKAIPEEDKTPVTVLTGFLGSGKTTLLNYILEEQREKKIAVIENEFGEIPIDDALLKQNKLALAEKVVIMDNGCICCTIRGDLEQGLQSILDEMRKGNHIDAIMIETTGMADPVPIVRTFMTSPSLTSKLRLDGVIALADAKHLEARLDDKVEEGKVNEAYQQIAFCDKVILNKLDLVTSEEAIKVKDRIREINKFAKVLPAVRSKVKLSELSDMRAHDMSNFVNGELEQEAEDCQPCSSSVNFFAIDRGNSKKSRHDSLVNSFSVVREGNILPQRLGQWMQKLGQMPEEKGTIFRIKAILAIKNHPYKHAFHAVMDVSDEDDLGPWEEGEKRISKIVFIGKSLDKKWLCDGFEGIFE